jgi:hypothetical protein
LADNPGTWMFHCHLDFHSEIGMSMLLKVGKKNDLPPEPEGWPKCGNFYYHEKKDLLNIAINLKWSISNMIVFVTYFVFASKYFE